MKKLLAIALCLLLLSGCSSHSLMDPISTPPPTEPTSTAGTTGTTAAPHINFFVYQANEQLDGYIRTEVTIEKLDPNLILQAMQNIGVLREDVQILSHTITDGQLNLDMNDPFMAQLCSLGALTEGLLMGSVVNTFLSAYTDCETMMVTVEGNIIHSGHVDYDFPMHRDE